MSETSKRWEAKVELFGPRMKRVTNWVLKDPEGLVRARFYGTGSDKEQGRLAQDIAWFLNNELRLEDYEAQ